MATIGNSVLTLADWASRTDPDGDTADIVEILEQTNPLLQDMHFEEGNLATGNVATVRTGLPTVYWRMINQGLPPSKSTTAQATDTTGMLEAWSETDKDLVLMSKNPARLRMTEASAFIEAMNQEAAQTIIYGNGLTAPEEFTGLAPRYSSLSAGNAQNIVDGAGTGSDNTSLWLVVWGANTVHGIFPLNSKAGIDHEDLGLVTVETTAGVAGNRMRAYQDHWQWKLGLAVPDWRYAARAANIDVSNLVAKTSAADISELAALLIDRIPNISRGRAVFYGSRTLVSRWGVQDRDEVSTGGGLDYANVDGRRRRMFRDIPVEALDALLDTEARVT